MIHFVLAQRGDTNGCHASDAPLAGAAVWRASPRPALRAAPRPPRGARPPAVTVTTLPWRVAAFPVAEPPVRPPPAEPHAFKTKCVSRGQTKNTKSGQLRHPSICAACVPSAPSAPFALVLFVARAFSLQPTDSFARVPREKENMTEKVN